jgi:hypothetical protein
MREQISEYLHVLETTCSHLNAVLLAHGDAQLNVSLSGKEWSAGEVMAHLRACAEVFGKSIYEFLHAENPSVEYIHPNRWMSQKRYDAQPFSKNLTAFTSTRAELLLTLQGLNTEDWERGGTIKGRTHTVFGEVRRIALHEQSHYSYLLALCAA